MTTRDVRELGAAPTCTVTDTLTDRVTYGDDTAGKPRGSIVTIDHEQCDDQSYEYDPFNRMTEATDVNTDPDTGAIVSSTTEARTYDSLDRLASQTDGSSDDVTFGYSGEETEAESEDDSSGQARAMLETSDGTPNKTHCFRIILLGFPGYIAYGPYAGAPKPVVVTIRPIRCSEAKVPN